MKKLRIILKSKQFIIILLLLTLIRLALYIKEDKKSIYDINDNNFICTILNINQKNYTLDCGEIIEGEVESNDLSIGDIIKVKGNLEEFKENKNINLFNYKNYQKNKGIFYKLKVKSYKKIDESKNIVIKLKKSIVNKIENMKSASYLNAFVLGDKSKIDKNIIDAFKNLGIIHLFSVSGMHISFLLELLDKIYSRKTKLKQIITIIFLTLYYFLIKSISLFRCLIFLIVKSTNTNLNLNIKKELLILISILLILLAKPESLFNIGFYYSVIISSGISIYSSKLVKIKSKFIKSLVISIISFLLSFPLNIYSYFEVNILSIIYNIIFIPFVSIILFPLSLITLLIPLLDNLFYFLINLFQDTILFFNNYSISLIFRKPSILVIILYYLVIFIFLYNYKFIYIFIFITIFHYNYNLIVKDNYFLMLDVGQGDSYLLSLENNNILIDTGGMYFRNGIAKYTTIPLLKSLGINKLDYLILSHGDYDHMGEAVNLINNFKVEKVIFNCGSYNDLEETLIKKLNKKKIKYYSCINELNINNNKLEFLNTKIYDNENDNSNVIYFNYNNYKFLFMGDAGIEKEKDILDKYNLKDIDFLKVGHHGSNTSSSKIFIESINPKYSLISVGENNRYGHPNKEVLKKLNNSKIFRTDINGSIEIKLNKNGYKIRTYLS